jgi:hypothetical protein
MPTFVGMTGETAHRANLSIRSLLGVALRGGQREFRLLFLQLPGWPSGPDPRRGSAHKGRGQGNHVHRLIDDARQARSAGEAGGAVAAALFSLPAARGQGDCI